MADEQRPRSVHDRKMPYAELPISVTWDETTLAERPGRPAQVGVLMLTDTPDSRQATVWPKAALRQHAEAILEWLDKNPRTDVLVIAAGLPPNGQGGH